eukprot:9389249-Pyramimonas_sp.AAC.1
MFKLPRAGPRSFLTEATLRRLKRDYCGCLGSSGGFDSQQVPLVPHQTSSHSSDEELVSVSRVGLGEAQSVALEARAVNCNAWGTTKEILVDSRDQEQIQKASGALLRAGWRSMWQPGIPGPQGGDSCGVAVFARSWLGAIGVPVFEGEAGRSFVCKVPPPAIPSCLSCPIYLQRSVGVGERNGKILISAGSFLTSQEEEYIIG